MSFFLHFATSRKYIIANNDICTGHSLSLGSNPAIPLRPGIAPTPGLRYKNLGKSGLRVSNVGLGTWPIFSPGVTEEQAEAIIKLAYDSGINIFDISEAHSGMLLRHSNLSHKYNKIFYRGRIGQNYPKTRLEEDQICCYNKNILEHEVR